MISTQQVVEELVRQAPFLENAVAEDIVNYSSLARVFKPEIEERLLKDIKDGSIIMALKRVSVKLKGKLHKNENILGMLADITIRSNLVDYTFHNSSTLTAAVHKIVERTERRKDVFITISRGVSQVTVVASQALEPDIKEIFKNESSICEIEGLSSITVRIPLEATKMPGVLYTILKLLAWNGISLIEMISTFTELSIVLETKDIEKVFSLFKNP